MKTPTIRAIRELLVSLKSDIGDDYRADDENDTPAMSVTVGADTAGDWSYQTGDNSFSGGAYHYPYWAVVTLERRSNSTELARDIIEQLAEQFPDPPKRFRQLAIGQTFDFISPDNMLNSFSDNCKKISNRKYASLETGLEYQIGSVNCEVYHVS